MRARLLAMAGVFAVGATPAAQALNVGDKAPAITASKWYNSKGPVTLSKLQGQIVVIDFWATW